MTAARGSTTLMVEGDAALAEALEPLRDDLDARLAARFPASLSLGVVDRTGLRLRAHGGLACAVGEAVPATSRTCYDLASLTKVVCTCTLVLLARERGLLELDDPVQRWLPRFPVRTTTLRHLLTHTSGLVPHRPFFERHAGREAIERAVLDEAEGTRPGGGVSYSDLNFMLLGWALEACFGGQLDELFERHVAVPAGMRHARFRPPPDARPQIAATELDGDQRTRAGLVWGEVHDGNAFALGGVAGHAGLFADLDDLATFASSHLSPRSAGLLREDSVALLASRQAATGDDVRGIGWRLEPAGWGTWPEGTIWHTGFTGTSLLVAPSAGVGVVLLTNAIHPHRRLEDQAELRARVHRHLAKVLR